MSMASSTIFRKIRNLLVKGHSPFIESGPSTIAGRGIFALTTIPKHEVVALYPGIYTPPLPHFLEMPVGDSNFPVADLYLANKISPSGIHVEENAYILNLQHHVGGFLDGACLTSARGRPLDENPSARGHLINHSNIAANVEFESFVWSDIVLDSSCDPTLYAVPNERRQDGTPWYADGDRLVRFLNPDDLIQRNLHAVGGAAFLTKRVIHQGEELFLDYLLRKPYPEWARGWYTGS